MKNSLVFILLNTLFTSFSIGQSTIWKVDKGEQTIYIGGTVHLLRAEDYPLPKEFDLAYSNSDVLVFETDLDEIQSPEVANKMLASSQYGEEEGLSKNLSDEVYNALKASFETEGLTLANFEKFKPSMVVLTLTAVKMQKMGLQSEGVDQYFFNKAKEDRKGLAYLESVDEQIELLTSMGDGNEDDFILKSLEDLDEFEDGIADLIKDWKNGTSETMLTDISDMKKEYPEIYKSLLVERNNNWLPKIEELYKSDPIELILVGSLHLYGDDGLLEKLKKKGYTIHQF